MKTAELLTWDHERTHQCWPHEWELHWMGPMPPESVKKSGNLTGIGAWSARNAMVLVAMPGPLALLFAALISGTTEGRINFQMRHKEKSGPKNSISALVS